MYGVPPGTVLSAPPQTPQAPPTVPPAGLPGHQSRFGPPPTAQLPPQQQQQQHYAPQQQQTATHGQPQQDARDRQVRLHVELCHSTSLYVGEHVFSLIPVQIIMKGFFNNRPVLAG